MKPRHVAALIVVAGPLLLGACGTARQDAPPPPATVQTQTVQTQTVQTQNVTNVSEITAGPTFNDTDVMFLQMLIDNLEQGQEMTRIAATRATRPEVAQLAEAVQATQADEITLMKSWLAEWNRPTTLDKRISLHADHGGLPSTGDEEMASLRTVGKAQFETTFLNLFLAHQHNAVEFAQMELDRGGNELAKSFAERVEQSRTDQVQQMLKLLAT